MWIIHQHRASCKLSTTTLSTVVRIWGPLVVTRPRTSLDLRSQDPNHNSRVWGFNCQQQWFSCSQQGITWCDKKCNNIHESRGGRHLQTWYQHRESNCCIESHTRRLQIDNGEERHCVGCTVLVDLYHLHGRWRPQTPPPRTRDHPAIMTYRTIFVRRINKSKSRSVWCF